MSRVVRFDRIGGPEVLHLVERDLPAPGPGEVRVAMRAAGLNRAELLFVRGAYLITPEPPDAPLGMEGAGVVEVVGADVSHVAPGDRVAILPMLDMVTHGVLGEAAVVPSEAVVTIPDGASFAEAAAFWMAFGTAWGMLRAGKAAAGEAVLITGASSSVGLAGIQLAQAQGAVPVALTRTGVKRDALLAAGAAHVISTDEEDVAARVAEITGGRGARTVCDAVGGPLVETLAEAAADEGTIVLMGLLSGTPPGLPFYPILARGVTVTGFHLVFRLLDHADRRAEMAADLSAAWARGDLAPVIDRTFPLDAVADAYAHLASNAQVGKVVVEIGG